MAIKHIWNLWSQQATILCHDSSPFMPFTAFTRSCQIPLKNRPSAITTHDSLPRLYLVDVTVIRLGHVTRECICLVLLSKM